MVSLNVDKVTGVISLSDILNFLVLRPGGDDPSQPGCTDMFSKVHYMLQIFEQRDHIICPSWFVFLLYVRVRSDGIFKGSDHFRFSLLWDNGEDLLVCWKDAVLAVYPQPAKFIGQ